MAVWSRQAPVYSLGVPVTRNIIEGPLWVNYGLFALITNQSRYPRPMGQLGANNGRSRDMKKSRINRGHDFGLVDWPLTAQ